MPTCVLTMSSYDLQHLDNQLNTMELEEEQLLPSDLLQDENTSPADGNDWILDECKFSRKQKRCYSDYEEADMCFQQSKRQDVGCGSSVLRESYTKLSEPDKATFKAIILDRTKNGPMDFGPYYVIEQVQEGKINIIQKEIYNRMRYISAKFDNSTHIIDNWNKVYMNDENKAPIDSLNSSTVTSNTVSPSITDSENSEDDPKNNKSRVSSAMDDDSDSSNSSSNSTNSSSSSMKHSNKCPSPPGRVLRFASKDDVMYI